MSKQEYLKQLQKYLKRLPEKEYQEAIDYFTEHFEDAGDENEQAVIEELGPPKEAAAELLASLLDQKTTVSITPGTTKENDSVWKTLLIAILAIFAAPIGIPLLLCAVLLFLAMVCIIISLGIAAFSFLLCGILVGGKLILRGILAIPFSVPGFCLISGTGLLVAGICILLFHLTLAVTKWMARKTILLIKKYLKRGNKHEKKNH